MSEKTVCPYCGGEITAQDTICPHCNVNLKTGKPVFRVGCLITVIAISLIPLILGFVFIYHRDANSNDHSELFAFAMAVLILIPCIKSISENAKLRRALKNDPTLYKQMMVQRRLDKEAQEKKEEKRLEHIPACPICGSKQKVNRLTEIDRSASTAVFGVASARIGKQWECAACNYCFNIDASPVPYPQSKTDTTHTDPAEELRKYKQLLDDGVITQDDFDQKKKQLLDL